MKIKTKLYISLYLSVCTMLVVMMALYWSYREQNKADENERLVVEIQKAIFERTSLRDEYLQYREERAKIEWQKKTEYAEKVMDLVSERFKDDMSKAILNEMRRNYESTVAIFPKIVENRERKDLNEKEKALSREYENRLYSQILLKSHALSETTQRLLESSRRKSGIALKKTNLLTVIFVLALMITTITNSVLLSRILRKRLGTIHKGTKIIGSGNLDYRIDLRSKDEFEDLSNEFNAMSDKLKKSFVSIESLEKEIIERQRTEAALQESEEKYRTLFEGSKDAVYITSREGKIINLNQAYIDLFGYSVEDLKIINASETYVNPVDRDRFRQEIEQKGFVRNFEVKLRKKDRTEIDCLLTSTVRRANDGSTLGYQGVIHDITERKEAEEALRESEERSRSLIETSPDVIVLIDFSGKIIVVNGVALTTYGYESRDELIGRSVLDFVIPEDRPRVLQEISKVLGVKTLRNLEYTSLKKDGSTFSIEVSASLILDGQQKPTSIVIMIRDITERKQAEEEREKLIKELQKALAEVKTLSGLIPICASCKKIRDDKGYWGQIESYISDHSEAEFSHSICPDCMKKLYPDFAEDGKY